MTDKDEPLTKAQFLSVMKAIAASMSYQHQPHAIVVVAGTPFSRDDLFTMKPLRKQVSNFVLRKRRKRLRRYLSRQNENS